MLEFLKFYYFTHTTFFTEFLSTGVLTKVINHQVFPWFFFLWNLSLAVKIALVVQSSYKQPVKVPIKEWLWRRYGDLLILDVLQSFCFWQYFETSRLGVIIQSAQWVTPMEHICTAIPVATLLVMMLYQVMTLLKTRQGSETLFVAGCRWFLVALGAIGSVLMVLKLWYIFTGQNPFSIFTR